MVWLEICVCVSIYAFICLKVQRQNCVQDKKKKSDDPLESWSTIWALVFAFASVLIVKVESLKFQ